MFFSFSASGTERLSFIIVPLPLVRIQNMCRVSMSIKCHLDSRIRNHFFDSNEESELQKMRVA
jgi:hypothetical protein